MADLVGGGSDEQHFVYRPFQGSWAAGAMYLGGVTVLAALTEAPLWPPLPPASNPHVLFWSLLLLSPAMIASIGWSYALTPTEFVALRFGNERFRLPLWEFKGNTTVMGMVWLQFASRRVFVVSGPDQDRQTFLRELEVRAGRATGKPASPSAVEAEGGGLRVHAAVLRFPAACVVCGAPPAGMVSVEASHWFGIPVVQGIAVSAPVCAAHRLRERLVRWLAWTGVFGIGLGIGAVWGLSIATGPPWIPGVLLIGAIIGGVLLRAAGFLHLRTWCGWVALGLRTSNLSGDLQYFTIHTRSAALRRALLQLTL